MPLASFSVKFFIALHLNVAGVYPPYIFFFLFWFCRYHLVPWFTLKSQESKKPHAGQVQFQEAVLYNQEGT